MSLLTNRVEEKHRGQVFIRQRDNKEVVRCSCRTDPFESRRAWQIHLLEAVETEARNNQSDRERAIRLRDLKKGLGLVVEEAGPRCGNRIETAFSDEPLICVLHKDHRGKHCDQSGAQWWTAVPAHEGVTP